MTNDWPRARLHVVTGKGGTGKTTVASALALALASRPGRVLLSEVEGRQGISQTFDVPPLGTDETRILRLGGGGEVIGLSVEPKAALLEYLHLFYKLGRAGKLLEKFGAIDFATTIAPGVRDVLLIGKIYEANRRRRDGRHKGDGPLAYDALVLDAPPTGRIVSFLDVTRAMSDLARTGPIHSQSEGVVKLVHSPQTAVHLVTLLEDLPVTETLETIADLQAAELRPGAVIVNRVRPQWLPDRSVAPAADGRVDAGRIRTGLAAAGVDLAPAVLEGLVAETVEHAVRVEAEAAAMARLRERGGPLLELPNLVEGVDLGTLYELAEALVEQGVGA